MRIDRLERDTNSGRLMIILINQLNTEPERNRKRRVFNMKHKNEVKF